MNEQLIQFDEYLKLQGKSSNTRRSYLQKVKKFLEYTNGDISQNSLNKFLVSLQGVLANKTVNCYRDGICNYVSWKKLNLEMPPSLKFMRKMPDAINIEDFEDKVISLIDMSFNKPDKVKAIFYLMFYSGLRPSEVVGLKRKDIDLKNLNGKKSQKKVNEEDIFIFTKKVAAIIKIYFLMEDEKSNAFNITERGIGKMTEKIKADCPKFNLRPYLFRHSSATRLLDEGFSLVDIQGFLGHKDLRSTQCYLKTSKEEFKKKYLERIK